MYTYVFIVILSASSCFCYAGYELFQGFDSYDVGGAPRDSTATFLTPASGDNETRVTVQIQQNTTTPYYDLTLLSAKLITPTDSEVIEVKNLPVTYLPTYGGVIETSSPAKFDCPEAENPSNIGPYEVPTQGDMALFIRNVLLDMFNSINKEAFFLLKDIRAATKATSSIEKKCKGNKMEYRNCVKLVSRQYQQITKNLVKDLEYEKEQISNLTNVKICNLLEMSNDPIKIMKSLAQQRVSLEFALPGFLRLLNACNLNCIRSTSESSYSINKPMRHMTDQDLVVKHLLTHKNYLELIMDSKHKSTGNSN